MNSRQMTEDLLTHYRGIFATLFLLPISAIYSAYTTVRNKLVFIRQSAPAKHDERVANIIQQIQSWQKQGCKEKLCTARSGWKTMSEMVPTYKFTHRNIHIDLYDILQIDEEKQIIKVEPLANMGQITRTLIPLGWTLAVVPELDDLTVGGLIMGFGVETSSHKYGLFQYICESFDVVTAEGKLLHCSDTENEALFYTLPWSHGTLGFLVAAELKIIPAKPYVKLQYKPVYTLEGMVEQFDSECAETERNDFVEGLVYARDKAVIITGKMVDKPAPDGSINKIGRWYKPWFYKHVEAILNNGNECIEYIPLRHYYHRHTRSLFWMMEEIIPFGNQAIFRYLLGWAVPPKISLLKYTETETTRELREKHQILQDMLVPICHLRSSIEYFDQEYQIYPLWLSPMAIYDNPLNAGFLHPFPKDNGDKVEMYVDIGAYGTPKKQEIDNRESLPNLEKFVLEHHGYQALYAKTLLNRADFHRMFDHTSYNRLRQEIPMTTLAFDEIHDKVTKGRSAPIEAKKLAKKIKSNLAVMD